MKQLQFNC